MVVPTDNSISVKEYDEINKYKNLKIEIEKMWHIKTIIVPVIVGTLGMIKKGKDKHINKITDCSRQYEIQKKMHFAELLESTINMTEKYQPKKQQKYK